MRAERREKESYLFGSTIIFIFQGESSYLIMINGLFVSVWNMYPCAGYDSSFLDYRSRNAWCVRIGEHRLFSSRVVTSVLVPLVLSS